MFRVGGGGGGVGYNFHKQFKVGGGVDFSVSI